MENQFSFPNADQLLSAYANFIHVCSAEKRDACAVLKKSLPTFNKWMANGKLHWIEADKDAPPILHPMAWFETLYGKMRNATRDPDSLKLTPEELVKLCAGTPPPTPPPPPPLQAGIYKLILIPPGAQA